MSIVQLDPPPIQPMLMVVPWHDPVVDTVGHDVRSVYVELFWLNILGPSATWILRRLVQGLDRYPLGYEVDLGDMAGSLGLAYTAGNSNPFSRALQRCSMFGVAHPIGGGLAVRRRVPPVAQRHLQRMPESLRLAHVDWVRRDATATSMAETQRARVLADAMIATGDDPDVIERQLLSLGICPETAALVSASAVATSARPTGLAG